MGMKTLGTVLHTLRQSLRQLEIATLTDGELLERFVRRRDEAAFETLLHRHGPMVLGACRRVLDNESDAEDAFQATFLVLARKAGSVRPRGMVGNWLYGVAHSTALKARAMRTRRSARERTAAMQAAQEAPEVAWEDLEGLLDLELKAMPQKYRAVIVLCDLEGKSLKEAAQELRCPPATIGTRLARGRAMLARRLGRQGVALSATALGVALSQNASAAVSPLLAAAFMNNAAGDATASLVSPGLFSDRVTALADSMLRTMLLTKLKMVSALLMPVIIGVAGLAGTRWAGPSQTAADQGERVQMCGVVGQERPRPDVFEGMPINQQPGPDRSTNLPESRSDSEPRPKKLPPGLASKSARHPGRTAWLKSHGS